MDLIRGEQYVDLEQLVNREGSGLQKDRGGDGEHRFEISGGLKRDLHQQAPPPQD